VAPNDENIVFNFASNKQPDGLRRESADDHRAHSFSG